MSNAYSRILKTLKTVTKVENLNIMVAKIIKPPPDIVISFNNIEIKKENILISSSLLQGYQRTFEIIEGTEEEQEESELSFDVGEGEFSETISTEDSNLTYVGQGTLTDLEHNHDIKDFKIKNNKFTAKGTLKLTDTLKEEDLVLVLSLDNNQTFIIVDKVVQT